MHLLAELHRTGDLLQNPWCFVCLLGCFFVGLFGFFNTIQCPTS